MNYLDTFEKTVLMDYVENVMQIRQDEPEGASMLGTCVKHMRLGIWENKCNEYSNVTHHIDKLEIQQKHSNFHCFLCCYLWSCHELPLLCEVMFFLAS